jgi:TfoX/Sxy family transcriptional regulator of competence genes
VAFDEALADRVRDVLAARPELSERRMFGGIAFMLAGNMCCGVIDENLLVRLGDDAPAALSEPHTRPMDFTGKPMRTTIYVEPEGTAADADLAKWVEAGADFAASLPPKQPKNPK